ncbi:hypothetical protein ACFTUC_17325 [Streptomyces sp. NPDC056944]|uniref:hypothetical protein n=1 Tax=Streptomyces sp. NPDC056944 TaxID=3345972 RepID=UPI0036418D8D
MARKVVESVTCDACAKKGLEVVATERLTIMDKGWDMCVEHAERFRNQLADALDPVEVALSA